MNINLSTASCGITPADVNNPIAMGKSNPEPSFFKSAGAKFTVILSTGRAYPELRIAA